MPRRLLIPFFLIGVALLSQSCSKGDPNEGTSGASVTIELLSRLPLNAELTDVSGYVDAASGREYALVGFGGQRTDSTTGFYIIDVTDPRNPVETAVRKNVPGFDLKVWQNYLFTVNGSSDVGQQGAIFDLSNISNPSLVGTIASAHNLFIAESGFMYALSPGVRIYNLNANPANPNLLPWIGGTEGHDATVIGNRLYDFHGFSGVRIYDVTNPTAPVLLGSFSSPDITYHHSGWPTEDGNYLLITNELAGKDQADLTVWDIRNPANPEMVDVFDDPTATVHNAIIIGNFAYTSYYNAGFRIFDIENPENITLAAEFDTRPDFNTLAFGGAFGVYPFAPGGKVYVSDSDTGLHIFAVHIGGGNSQSILAP